MPRSSGVKARPEGLMRRSEWYAGTGRNGYIHRAWMRRGLPDHAFDGRPHIAIANTASDLTPCNALTAVGILGASAGLAGTIERFAAGAVDPRPLVAATVGLEQVGDVLSGWRPSGAGTGPKIHVDQAGEWRRLPAAQYTSGTKVCSPIGGRM